MSWVDQTRCRHCGYARDEHGTTKVNVLWDNDAYRLRTEFVWEPPQNLEATHSPPGKIVCTQFERKHTVTGVL